MKLSNLFVKANNEVVLYILNDERKKNEWMPRERRIAQVWSFNRALTLLGPLIHNNNLSPYLTIIKN